MCRFVSFLGKAPTILGALLDQPEHGLISQSRGARIGQHNINADGFGIAWYNHRVDETPALFRSVQPAWNDSNLRHLAAKVRSNCFLGHVRASTVGDVSISNCHPFIYQHYAFVHNGTIDHFPEIRRQVVEQLSDDLFLSIKGLTDSEHLFRWVLQHLDGSIEDEGQRMLEAVKQTFSNVIAFQEAAGLTPLAKMNIVLTDGHRLLATRFSVGGDAPSLFYALGRLDHDNDQHMMVADMDQPSAVIIASEPLNDYAQEWHEVPEGHYLLVDDDLNFSTQALL